MRRGNGLLLRERWSEINEKTQKEGNYPLTGTELGISINIIPVKMK